MVQAIPIVNGGRAGKGSSMSVKRCRKLRPLQYREWTVWIEVIRSGEEMNG